MNRPDDSPKNSIIIYTTEDGLTKIDTTFDGDTVWLSIDQMAELFQRDKSTISRHIKNIFAEGELERDSVVAKFATTAADGKTYQVEFYNLDVIISVGYRVKSKRGTQFRIWATGILKEYMRKGFALDDERLKNLGGGGYFKELLERIRDIRASEKRHKQRCKQQHGNLYLAVDRCVARFLIVVDCRQAGKVLGLHRRSGYGHRLRYDPGADRCRSAGMPAGKHCGFGRRYRFFPL